MSREHFLQNPMADIEDSFVELLRVTMADQNVVQDLAEKLRTHGYTVPLLLALSDSELDGVIDEVLPAASRAQRLGIKSAIRTRLSMEVWNEPPHCALYPHFGTNCRIVLARLGQLQVVALGKSNFSKAAMSTMNIYVRNVQLPLFLAGQPASEVYKHSQGRLRGRNADRTDGVAILNNNGLVPAGNYTYLQESHDVYYYALLCHSLALPRVPCFPVPV